MPHIMMTVLRIFFLLLTINSFGQNQQPEEYGFRHLQTIYKGDVVDILIRSKKGEDQKIKPLFLFCQGSLPQPLIKFDEHGVFGVFPFNPDSLLSDYHLAIISKPYVPLIGEKKLLGQNFTYLDSTGSYPKKYSERNLLDYYVNRNIVVIKYLQKQKWVSKNKLVVAGHSEGSTIAAKLALKCSKVTHLIYSSGNPMGRIMSVIEQNRALEIDTDSTKYVEENIKYWEHVVLGKTDIDISHGDTYKATFEFSIPPKDYLEKLKIPILICYGTKDWSAPFNEFLWVDIIRKGKNNFTFMPYIGTDHNFFPVLPDGKPNYEIFNWDRVSNDWLKWLRWN
jgi:dienelactone hydrolase